MTSPAPAVVDSSVGVKWFVAERGSEIAVQLLERQFAGDVSIVVPDLFVYEVLRTVRRKDPQQVARLCAFFTQTFITTVPPDDRLIAAAFEQSTALGCDLYDAFPAGLASMLDAPLYSADVKAHGRYPGVVLVGV